MSITCCFHFFFPSVPKFVHCSFSHIIMPIVFCAFLSVLCLSSSFLLITIHECISALYWPKIGCPQTCGAALEIFFTKHTISILGFTFLSIHMVCNSSKVLPYIMWCITLWLLLICKHQKNYYSLGQIKVKPAGQNISSCPILLCSTISMLLTSFCKISSSGI